MKIRRLVGGAATAVILTVGFSPVAFAGNGKVAHWNQADGCAHGNSGKPCRPDPQPNKGKDCLPHGNWGGVNEDHCAPVVTPPADPGGDGNGGW